MQDMMLYMVFQTVVKIQRGSNSILGVILVVDVSEGRKLKHVEINQNIHHILQNKVITYRHIEANLQRLA